jgi:hypothetical protein
VAEVLDRVEASGGRVLGGACLPYYANVSLWPIARILERVLAWPATTPSGSGWLVTHLSPRSAGPGAARSPSSAPLIGVPATPEYPAPELDPSAFLDETLDRLVDWLSAYTERRPRTCSSSRTCTGPTPPPSNSWVASPSGSRRGSSRWPPRATTRSSRGGTPSACSELGRLDGAAARLVDNLAAGKSLTAISGLHHRARRGHPAVHRGADPLQPRRAAHRPMPLRLQELLTWRLKAPGSTCAWCRSPPPSGRPSTRPIVAAVIGDEDAVAEQLEVLAEAGIVEPLGPRWAPTGSATR